MYYKLVDAVDQPTSLSIVKRDGSSVKYCTIRLEPGKKYEIPEKDILDQLLKARKQIPYSARAEETLRSMGVAYEKKVCKSCGGKVLKLEYNVVEVIDDAKA